MLSSALRALVMVAVLSATITATAAEPVGDPAWPEAAERAQGALRQHYWDGATHLFRNRADETASKGFNYWWQAHALTCVARAVQRGSTVWKQGDLAALRDALLKRNGGHWTNDYYDDEGWMACAMLDAANATNDAAYRDIARGLWDDIHVAWNDQYGGGIPWRKSQLDYKNAPANGPAMFLGAALYQRDRRPDDLAQAVRIHEWLVTTLRDPDSGLLWDGINRTGKGAIDKAWRFTYSQGIFIGACLELGRATHQARYLADAERTGGAALDAFFTAGTGLCHEGGSGDGGLFKGILVHHLGALATASPRLAPRIRAALAANGQRLARLQAEHPDALLPTTWDQGAAPADLELSVHLSGTLLLEALAAMDRHGVR